jgi:hypothetical protein
MLSCQCDPLKDRYRFFLTARIDVGSCAFPSNIRRLVSYPISSNEDVLILPAALLWYDYALTWTREVQYFWTKRFTLSTALYILCRYGMVANVLYTVALADKLPKMRVRLWNVENGYRTDFIHDSMCTQYLTLLRTSIPMTLA